MAGAAGETASRFAVAPDGNEDASSPTTIKLARKKYPLFRAVGLFEGLGAVQLG
jgi:hypothetical protein